MRYLLVASWLLLGFVCLAAQKPTQGPHIYRVGVDDVKPPQAVFTPEPDMPENMGKVKSAKIAILSAIVGIDGQVYNPKVVRSTGDSALDNKAIDKLGSWKFHPCMKDGQAVNCAMNLEVTFRLYNAHK
jgi:TonB family protein